MEINMMGIDLSKEKFQIYAIDAKGRRVFDKCLNKKAFIKFLVQTPKCKIFIEACGGSNYWGRKLRSMGHEVKLISPQHVTPFVGPQKNDRNDSRAIVEAGRRLEAKFVSIKEPWQQDIQCLHRIRDRVQRNRVGISNQIRGLLLEYGVTIPVGRTNFEKHLLPHLEDAENELTPMVRELLQDLYVEYCFVKEWLNTLNAKVEAISKQSEECKKLEALSGVGPVISTAFISTIGDPRAFKNGRQVSAWLGLVPRQHSTGGKTILRCITKNGDQYLRKLVIQGARTRVQAAMKRGHKTEEDLKILSLKESKGFNKAAVAVANKNARRMWAEMMYN